MPNISFMRKTCRSCNSEKLLPILSLGNLHLSDFASSNRKPPKYPLNLTLCKNCMLVQLKHTVPASILYTDNYGYKSGINKTMKEELRDIVEKAQKKIGKRNKKIIAVDIGANDGTLLGFYPKQYFKIAVEPINKLAKECKKNANVVINDFFNKRSYLQKAGNKKADIITAISCFYDIDDPNVFVSDVKKILHPKGVFIIQQNYLLEMLRQNAYDNIVHEHLEYYSLFSLEKLLAKHGLEIYDVEVNNINGGSFRTYIKHIGSETKLESVVKQKLVEEAMNFSSKKTYTDFAKRVKKNRKDLRNFILEKVKEGKTVYIYGASTRGNTLIQYCNLDNKLIRAAVERNKEKWGKKISSVGIPIISEEQGRLEKPDYMLVLPWFFKTEFLKRENKYLKSGGHFIFPLPELEII